MSINDSISGLANYSITITRTTRVPRVNGIKQPGTQTTIGPIDVVAQPAYNLNRVIGGANLTGGVEGQTVNEIYQIHTTTRIFDGEDNDTGTQYQPDIINFRGKQWTVFRVEELNLDGEIHYHVVITRSARGGV